MDRMSSWVSSPDDSPFTIRRQAVLGAALTGTFVSDASDLRSASDLLLCLCSHLDTVVERMAELPLSEV
jgi:hypothetical protein